jgi:predicted 2-oxoglutarate/Fe(II)-dependent dioxygenase YbiX
LAPYGPDAALAVVRQIQAAAAPLSLAGIELVLLAPQTAAFAKALAGDEFARRVVVYVPDVGALAAFAAEGQAMAMGLDRAGRIVRFEPFEAGAADFAAFRDALASRPPDPPRTRRSAAPVLLVPNVMPKACCEALIAWFEQAPHRPGAMASVIDGRPSAKIDEAKKHRRDVELTAETAIHQTIVEILATRCAPEVKKAFQCDIGFADRILIARYDDTGGYFKRHRDNVAPHTAFRDFAVSINLNTDEYEGGELLFPEYDDDRYSPPAGGALIFSASLLHEAAPVTRGRRYVVLSFLCTPGAAARVTQAA